MHLPDSMLIAVASYAVASGAACDGEILFHGGDTGGLLPPALGSIPNHGFGPRDDRWTRDEQGNVRPLTRRARRARAISR